MLNCKGIKTNLNFNLYMIYLDASMKKENNC